LSHFILNSSLILCRGMIRPNRNKLTRAVEADETLIGAMESGKGIQRCDAEMKTLIAVTAECNVNKLEVSVLKSLPEQLEMN